MGIVKHRQRTITRQIGMNAGIVLMSPAPANMTIERLPRWRLRNSWRGSPWERQYLGVRHGPSWDWTICRELDSPGRASTSGWLFPEGELIIPAHVQGGDPRPRSREVTPLEPEGDCPVQLVETMKAFLPSWAAPVGYFAQGHLIHENSMNSWLPSFDSGMPVFSSVRMPDSWQCIPPTDGEVDPDGVQP